MKKLFDLCLAIFAILLLSPIWFSVTCFVAIKLGRPVLFTQVRPGLNGKLFKMYKFRSMTNARDDNGTLLADEKRLTSFGKALRATSLDELPGFINIIKGEMSFVGPRPLLVEYLPLYNTEQAKRHNVLPGITGWAQVNGRNNISWQKKFELDVWYVENQSFWLDLKILFLTFYKVVKRSDINHTKSVTMEKFKGNE